MNQELNIFLKKYGNYFYERFVMGEGEIDKIEFTKLKFLKDFQGLDFEFNILQNLRVSIPSFPNFPINLKGNEKESHFLLDFEKKNGIFKGLELTIGLPREFFKPVDWDSSSQIWKVIPDNNLEICLNTNLLFDDTGHIDELIEENDKSVFDEIEIEPFMIGNSGFVVVSKPVTVRFFNSNSNPGEKGFFIKEASLFTPFDLLAGTTNNEFQGDRFDFKDLKITAGGFSGTIVLKPGQQDTKPDSPPLFTLTKCMIQFEQNSIVQSEIEGELLVPFIDTDKPITIALAVSQDGGIHASFESTSEGGFYELDPDNPLADYLQFRFSSIEIEKTADNILFHLGCSVKCEILGLDWIDVNGFTIDRFGNISVDGGWAPLPEQLLVDFKGFPVELDKIGFGKEADWMWLGFKGKISLLEELPLIDLPDGLKFKWKLDDHGKIDYEFDISSLYLAFTIPGVLGFEGLVSYQSFGDAASKLNALSKMSEAGTPGFPDRKFFAGGVKFHLPSLNLKLDAQVLIGKLEDKDGAPMSLYLFLGGELPLGIPLFSTGLSLYGISGLYGQNLKPTKGTNQTWLDWATSGQSVDVTSCAKWTPIDARSHLALGAGCAIGTASDDGYLFNSNLLLVLTLPGPVLIFQGKGNFLTERNKNTCNQSEGLETLAVLDCDAGNFLFNLNAKKDFYGILDIKGSAEAFFDFNNPNNWHLYLGQYAPESKRLKASFLDLFEANSYLMLGKYAMSDKTCWGLATGAKIGFEKKWKFGPVRVKANALIEGNAQVNWSPAQFGGNLWFEGGVSLSAFGFGLGLSVGAGMAVNYPHPYLISAKFKAKMNLPWPLPDPKVKVKLEWKEKQETIPDFPCPLAEIGIEHLKTSEKVALAFSNSDKIPSNCPCVPLDVRPVISFTKPMVDISKVGVNAINWENPTMKPSHIIWPELVPPEKPKKGKQYRVKYELVALNIYQTKDKTGNSGFKSLKKLNSIDSGSLPEDSSGFLFGHWLPEGLLPQSPPDDDLNLHFENQKLGAKIGMTKMMLWAKSPFDYFGDNEDPSEYSDEDLGKICPEDFVPEWDCVQFNDPEILSGIEGPIQVDEVWCGLKSLEPSPSQEEQSSPPASESSSNSQDQIGEYDDPALKAAMEQFDEWLADQGMSYQDYLGPGGWELGVDTSLGLPIFENTELHIEFSHQMSQVKFTIVGTGEFGVRALNAESQLIAQNYGKVDGEKEIHFQVPNETIRTIILTAGGCHLKQVCYLPPEQDPISYTHEVKELAANIEKAINSDGNILEPDCLYRVEVETSALYRTDEDEEDAWMTKDYEKQYAYFQTGKGPGIEPDLNINFQALNSLESYISRVIPDEEHQPSYAHFRSYDLCVEFNEDYVARMYGESGNDLILKICDTNDNPLDVVGIPKWTKSNQITSSVTQTMYFDIVKCVDPNLPKCDQIEIIANRSFKNLSGSTLRPAARHVLKILPTNSSTPIFQKCFVTSRYTCFTEFLQTFRNAAWYQIDSSRTLEGIDNLLAPFAEAKGVSEEVHAVTFDKIAYDLFSLNYRDNPRELEVTLLYQEEPWRVLLVEFPERIDWNRTGLDIFGTALIPVEPAYSPVKIIDASSCHESTSPDDKWVDVIFLEDMSPRGLRVEISKDSPLIPNTNKKYTPFYRFRLGDWKELCPESELVEEAEAGAKGSDIWSAGTIVRLHAGSEPTGVDRFQDERINLYNDENSQVLDPSGTSFRILDSLSGKILHSHCFLPKANYTPLSDARVVRNKDDTKMLLFLPYTGENQNPENPLDSLISTARIRLEFCYNRKIDIVDYPVLSRLGRKDPEISAIEFSLPPKLVPVE